MRSYHHAYDARVGRRSYSRDRIARYRGGFEIHCLMDTGVQIPLSALNALFIENFKVPKSAFNNDSRGINYSSFTLISNHSSSLISGQGNWRGGFPVMCAIVIPPNSPIAVNSAVKTIAK